MVDIEGRVAADEINGLKECTLRPLHITLDKSCSCQTDS